MCFEIKMSNRRSFKSVSTIAINPRRTIGIICHCWNRLIADKDRRHSRNNNDEAIRELCVNREPISINYEGRCGVQQTNLTGSFVLRSTVEHFDYRQTRRTDLLSLRSVMERRFAKDCLLSPIFRSPLDKRFIAWTLDSLYLLR